MSPEDVDAQQTKTNDSFLLSVLNCISRSSGGHVQPQQPPWMTACAVWSLRGKARGITTLNLSARKVTVTLRSVSASCCGACPPISFSLLCLHPNFSDALRTPANGPSGMQISAHSVHINPALGALFHYVENNLLMVSPASPPLSCRVFFLCIHIGSCIF